MPKKYFGRFTEVDETNNLKSIQYGDSKVAYNIEGVEHLKEGDDVALNRILTDKDFKRIRIAKLK